MENQSLSGEGLSMAEMESAPGAMTVAAAAPAAPGSPQNGLWVTDVCVRGTVAPKGFSS